MADFVFNIAKGRTVEFYNRVESDDPPNSALIVMVVKRDAGPVPTDANFKDYDNFSTLIGDPNTIEVTNTNYARKVLTQADLAALPAPDDTNERYDVDIPDQTWTSVAAGDSWTDMIIGYDSDTTGGTDTNIIPLTNHTFTVTPAGSTITAQIALAGFFRAS